LALPRSKNAVKLWSFAGKQVIFKPVGLTRLNLAGFFMVVLSMYSFLIGSDYFVS
jgi:hypothetical protein